MSIKITSPEEGARLRLGEKVIFKGTANDSVHRVELFADSRYHLGSDLVENSVWSITYPAFNTEGLRQIVALGFDSADNQVASEEIEIFLSDEFGRDYELGIDVSDWNGNVNWPLVRSAGYSFAFIKATEGTTFVAASFQNNWEGAKEASVIRGAYHFFLPKDNPHNPEEQARHFLQTMGQLDPTDLPPVIDLERYPTYVDRAWQAIDFSTRINYITRWLQVVEQETNRRPIIYTNLDFWGRYTNNTEQFKNYPLWAANFTSRPVPLYPNAWRNWTFWQYTENGSVRGIQGNVDLNRFRGSFAQLTAFVNEGIISA